MKSVAHGFGHVSVEQSNNIYGTIGRSVFEGVGLDRMDGHSSFFRPPNRSGYTDLTGIKRPYIPTLLGRKNSVAPFTIAREEHGMSDAITQGFRKEC